MATYTVQCNVPECDYHEVSASYQRASEMFREHREVTGHTDRDLIESNE